MTRLIGSVRTDPASDRGPWQERGRRLKLRSIALLMVPAMAALLVFLPT